MREKFPTVTNVQDMPKSRLEKLIDQFDSGDYDLDSFKAVDVTVVKSAKSVFTVPLESSLYQNLVRIAKEKKITVEKALSQIIKKSLLKTV